MQVYHYRVKRVVRFLIFIPAQIPPPYIFNQMHTEIVPQFCCTAYGFMEDAVWTTDIKSTEVCEWRERCFAVCFLDLPNLTKPENFKKQLYETAHHLTFNGNWSSRELHKTAWNWKWRKSNLTYERLELWTWHNSMRQSPWDSNSFLASLLWNLKSSLCCSRGSPTCQINLVHTLTAYLYTHKIHFNIILFMPVYSK
jgi:hypothetical protein